MGKAVVTGGAGFIGSHLAEKLLSNGDSVLVIDNFYTGLEDNIKLLKDKFSGKVQFLQADVGDRASLQEIISFKPDFIYHLAAQGNVRKSVQAPIFDAQVNILGTINLLEAAREVGVKGFIFSSTGGAVYGEQESFPANENHRTIPECPYGLSKRAVELYLQYYARTYNFSCVALRYANVFGPRQNPKGETGVLAVFVERLLKKQGLVVNGDGEQTRDFVYVADVVEANTMTATAILNNKLTVESGFAVFNVGTSIETSVNQIVKVLKDSWQEIYSNTPWPKEVTVSHGQAVAGEQRRSVIDPSKLRKELGWEFKVDLKEGVLRTLRSFVL